MNKVSDSLREAANELLNASMAMDEFEALFEALFRRVEALENGPEPEPEPEPEPIPDPEPDQEVQNVNAVHRNGQTFITWSDVDTNEAGAEYRYSIYRNDELVIDGVLNNSAKQFGYAFNEDDRLATHLPTSVIEEGGAPLPLWSGLAVVTPSDEGDASYKVVALKDDLPVADGVASGAVHEAPAPIQPIKTGDSSERGAYSDKSVITGEQGLPLHVNLHGSRAVGGSANDHGDLYHYFSRKEWGYRDGLPGVFSVLENHNPDGNYLRIDSRDAIVHPNGKRALETVWFGYACIPQWADHEDVRAYNFTEQRMEWVVSWAAEKYGADPERVYCAGGSMGAWGSMTWALRHPETFAAIYPDRPRVRQRALPNFESYTSTDAPMADGSESYFDRMDMVKFVSEHPADLPFVGWGLGKADGYADWNNQIDMVAALTAGKHGFAFAWNNGNHSDGSKAMGAIEKYYPASKFARNESYPAFGNSSLDDDFTMSGPTVDDIYGVNLGFAWSNVIDEAGSWGVIVSNELATEPMTVDITPRRCQNFKPSHEAEFAWAGGVAVVDENGLITMPGVTINPGEETTVSLVMVSDPIPEPEPEPDPVPDPEPDGRPVDTVRYLTPTMLVFNEYNRQNRYKRMLNMYVLKGETTLGYNSMMAGGAGVDFMGATNTLLCDGVPVATDTPDPEISISEFVFDASTISEGWHVFDIECSRMGTKGVPLPMFVLHGDTVSVEQKWMPVVTDSQFHKMVGKHVITWVPTEGEPTALPLERRSFPAWSEIPNQEKMFKDWLIAPRFGQPREKCTDQHGIITTMHNQRYVAEELHRKYPTHPILDGPRGAAHLHLPTEIHPGTADIPEFGGIIHNTYVWDVHGLRKINPDGVMTTLCGYRHTQAPYWEDPGMGNADEPHRFLELVGDWSDIPEERRGFWNLWGACLDTYSTRQDFEADKVDLKGVMVHPHPEGVRWFAADTMNNRICEIRHTNKNHVDPPKITEFLPDLKGPFDCKEYQPDPGKRGTLIVSEREAHRVSEYDMDTGELIRHIVEGNPYAYVNEFRKVVRTSTLSNILSQDVVLPDGIDVVGDWLYFASTAMLQVRRVHLKTGEVQVCVEDYPETIRTVWYVKISVSDGTVGPKHTIYSQAWDNIQFGAPNVFVPQGADPDQVATWTNGPQVIQASSDAVSRGIGKMIDGMGYGTAVSAKGGRLVWGGHNVGIMQACVADSDDPLMNMNLTQRSLARKEYNAAKDAWKDKGYTLRYGDNGMGLYGEPLPWHDEDVRPYLEWFGHKEN